MNTDQKGYPIDPIGIKRRLCSAKELEEKTPFQMPLKEVQQAHIQGQDGNYHQAPVAYYDQLFLSTDILNWQKYTPPYPEETQDMIRLMETIFYTRRPTWDDIIQLLTSLFSTEEQYRTLTEAKKWLLEMVPDGTVNPQRWVEQPLPYDRPNRDYNTDEGRSLPYSHSTGTKKGSPQAYGYGKTCRSSATRGRAPF